MKNKLLWLLTCVVVVLGGCPAVDESSTNTATDSSTGTTVRQGASTTPANSSTGTTDSTATTTTYGTSGGTGSSGTSSLPSSYGSGTSSGGTVSGSAPTDKADPNDVLPAVDFVAGRFVSATAVFSVFGDLGYVGPILDPNTLVEWGTCPHVSIASGPDQSPISLDFGTGCAAACAGGDAVIGASGEIYWRKNYPAAVYVVDGFTVDGRVVTPYLVHPQINPGQPDIMNADMTLGATSVTLSGPCDFGVSGVGRTSGTLTLQIAHKYVLTFTTAAWTFDATAQVGSAAFAGMVVRPAINRNLLPEAGTATFTVTLDDGPHSVDVDFDPQTPIDGTVYVSMDGGAEFAHQLPSYIR